MQTITRKEIAQLHNIVSVEPIQYDTRTHYQAVTITFREYVPKSIVPYSNCTGDGTLPEVGASYTVELVTRTFELVG
jgi:hypothetical protein